MRLPTCQEPAVVREVCRRRALTSAGDKPEHMRSERVFTHLAGVGLIPASSGRTHRHRLNRDGARAANNALHTIVLVGMRFDERTRAYVERRTPGTSLKTTSLQLPDSYTGVPRTENPMSTKLYDGLRLTAHAPDLFELTRMISKRMREVFRELAVPIIARNVARVVDNDEVRERDMGGPLHNYLVYRARKLWLDEQAGLDDRMTFHDPLRFSIVFGQVDDDYGTRRLAYSFPGSRAYTDALLALEADGHPIFVDYHYQNQADRPAEVSDDEWTHRRDNWNRLLDADDRETDGTLGHLPGWHLPDSIEGVFDAVLLGYKDTTIDLNAQCTIEHRIRRALNRAVTLDLDLDEVSGINRVLIRNQCIERAISQYLGTAEGKAMPRPAPLPGARELDVMISELPPVYEPPAGAVARIGELYREQALAGD
ncbi:MULTISPECIES: transposase [unclassified Streptomyces]|uniref:transposase n=1 Tax=unclassified Streptomyces TaxID=2593676 RepID=UPI00386B52D2